MESPSSIYTKEEQQRLLIPHEYTREALSVRYQDCVSCRHRTEFTCIKCGYCYSCHWKREQVEEIELRDNLKDFYVSLPKAIKDDDSQKVPSQQDKAKDLDQRLERWGTLDVLGQPAEPICTYYRCHHKFSLHGSRRCRCKHPMNKTLGIQVFPSADANPN
jgi:hypothetical protein